MKLLVYWLLFIVIAVTFVLIYFDDEGVVSPTSEESEKCNREPTTSNNPFSFLDEDAECD